MDLGKASLYVWLLILSKMFILPRGLKSSLVESRFFTYVGLITKIGLLHNGAIWVVGHSCHT